jgi:hypothetical protein
MSKKFQIKRFLQLCGTYNIYLTVFDIEIIYTLYVNSLETSFEVLIFIYRFVY